MHIALLLDTRRPLQRPADGLVAEGRLVAPFRSRAASRRGYFVEQPLRAAGNPNAQDFVTWLLKEAGAAQAS